MKATHIHWDVDYGADGELLPTEMEIPDDVIKDKGSLDNALDAVAEYLSNETGFCHEGFEPEMNEKDNAIIGIDNDRELE